VTLGWLGRRLAECGANLPPTAFVDAPATSGSLGISLGYAGGRKFFRWNGDFAAKHAVFEADFGTGVAKLLAAAGLLSPEQALSEAMFF
jgi:hypothetical protein